MRSLWCAVSLLALAGSGSQFALAQPKDKAVEPYINPKTKRDRADEQLDKLKAQVKRDTTQPGHPVVEVKVYSQDVSADDLKELLAFKTIKRIDFMTNKVNGAGLAALAVLPLEYVFLPSNCPLNDEGLKSLAKLKTVKVLHVPQGKYPEGYKDDAVKELAALTNLEEVTVSYGVGDEALAQVLPSLKKLRKLNANNCKVGDKSMKALSELPEVRSVVLFGSAVSDAGYVHIGKIEKLEELRTSYDITDKGLASLGGLKNLKTLNLWNSFVSMKAVRDLPNLKNLKELDVSTHFIKADEAKKLAAELPGCKVIYKK